MAEFNCKFEVGQIVARKDQVVDWARGIRDNFPPQEVSSISFGKGEWVGVNLRSGFSGSEQDFLTGDEIKAYAIQYLAERIKTISLMGEIS